MNISEKLLKVLQWVEDVNVDIIDDEVVPGVTVEEFEVLKKYVKKMAD